MRFDNKQLLDKTKKENWPIGFSIGVAFFDTLPVSVDKAVQIADELMYKVKKSGKNSILFKHIDHQD